MEIYIIRHGETELNRLHIVQGSGVDSSLNDKGRAQSQAFFKKYNQRNFDVVISSKLKRTHETIAPFVEQKIPWEQTADINEICWGVHEGKPSEPWMIEAYKNMQASWATGDLDARLEEGESAKELLFRISNFVNHLKTRTEKRILVCSHGRAMRCLIAVLKDWPMAKMEEVNHANTGLYLVELVDGKFEFKLENDTSHYAYLTKTEHG